MNRNTLALAHGADADMRLSGSARMEHLVRGHVDIMRLAMDGSELPELLDRLAQLLDSVFAPNACHLSLFEGAKRIYRSGAFGEGVDDLPDPARIVASTGEAAVVHDFRADARWPRHAAKALVAGWHACSAVPIDQHDGVSGAVVAYHRSAGAPDAADQQLLDQAAALIGLVIRAAHRERASRSIGSQFASLASSLPGVIYQRSVHPDGDIRYTYISDGARDLFGVSPEEILSDPDALFRSHAPEYKAKFRERLLAASKALTTWDVEATIVTPDGQKKYTHAIARPQAKADGSVLWTGIILDETRTREALVEALSQGFLLFDAEDKLVIRNSHYLELYPSLRDIAVPGATYEDIVLGEIGRLSNGSAMDLRQIPEFSERMNRHREPSSIYEQPLANDRWILVSEHRNREGGAVVLYTDISELRRRERDLHHLAYHDSLTGLPNRALFQQRIEQALSQASVRGTTVAIMCLDLDHFKNVNDTLGHPAGDALLKIIADRLSACFRESDTVARLGGDEFGIILTDLSRAETATMVAWRLLDVVAQPAEFNGQQIVTGLSIGIANSSTDGHHADELVKKADLALYRAKADGRSTFRFFQAEMDAVAQARRSLELDLRQALVKEQLELHYQPQIDISTDTIVGFEALVRWRHPERGLIPPADFIPLAEETGMIIRLGEWVLRQACTDALSWPESIKVAVNISAAQFKDQNLTQLVSGVLAETGLAAARLELEITESLLLRDVDSHLTTLRSLKALGIRISMDDFGTGYSSLGNLRSFPFDKIKIDRSFVGDLDSSRDAAAIVHAVLALGQSLGMSTCAEGVETLDQLDYLRSEQCTEVQGYFYSRPKPAVEIAKLLEASTGLRLTPGLAGCAPVPASPAPAATPLHVDRRGTAADRCLPAASAG